MSREGIPRNRRRAELLRRLEVVRPRAGDVLVLHLPAEYATNADAMRAAQELAGEVANVSKRTCFILTGDEQLTAEQVKRSVGERLRETEPTRGARHGD